MSIGPIEIGLIVIVAVLVLFIFRVSRMGRTSGSSAAKSGLPAKTGEKDVPQGGIRKFSGIAGLGLILIGIILLWSGMRLFKWAFLSYSWFLILAVIGLLLMVLARRKQ
jgi:hypothetical protein